MCTILDCLYLLIPSLARKFYTFSKCLGAWPYFLDNKVFYKFLLKSFHVLIEKPEQIFVILQQHIACHWISRKLLKASTWDWAWIYSNIYSIFSRHINLCTTFGFESILCIICMCTPYPQTQLHWSETYQCLSLIIWLISNSQFGAAFSTAAITSTT